MSCPNSTNTLLNLVYGNFLYPSYNCIPQIDASVLPVLPALGKDLPSNNKYNYTWLLFNEKTEHFSEIFFSKQHPLNKMKTKHSALKLNMHL